MMHSMSWAVVKWAEAFWGRSRRVVVWSGALIVARWLSEELGRPARRTHSMPTFAVLADAQGGRARDFLAQISAKKSRAGGRGAGARPPPLPQRACDALWLGAGSCAAAPFRSALHTGLAETVKDETCRPSFIMLFTSL